MTKSVYTLSSARLLYSLPLILLAGCGSPEERAQGFYEKGMELIAKQDDLGARVQLHSAIKYKADRVDVWRALVGVEERLKSGPSVFQDLRRVVELDPNDLGAKVKLARIMVAGGAGDAALKLIEIANDNDTPNAPFHALKATQRPAFLLDSEIGDRAVFSGFWKLEPLVAAVDSMLADAAAYDSYKAHFGGPPPA